MGATPSSKGKQAVKGMRGKTAGSRKTQIKPGQVLNPKGRPKGSRNRLSEDFLQNLADDFEKHGADAITEVRSKRPDVYVRVVADLVPKDVNLHHTASDAFLALWKQMQEEAD